MPSNRRRGLVAAAVSVAVGAPALAEPPAVQVGPRPLFLVDEMAEGPLKDELLACAGGPFETSDFSIAHRGAPLMFPEHTRQSYYAAAVMGAGVQECDVTFTQDRELVCRHSQCDLHTTTDILAIPELAAKCTEPFTPATETSEASATCCTSDITLAEFEQLTGKMDASEPTATTVEAYLGGTAPWRTELYASQGELLTHAEYIEMTAALGMKFTPELKSPSVAMPFEGDYTQENYAQQLVEDYEAAGIPPEDVYLQSFNLDDVRYWIENEPAFGEQAVYLDGRYDLENFDPTDPASFEPTMAELAEMGVRIVAPPMWMLLTVDDAGAIVPSPYAEAAKAAGLDIITWTFERSAPLAQDGDWYYQSIDEAVSGDGDMMPVLDVLARDVGVIGIFSDWPATVTYYANCTGLD
jgi:glycerophosphoryl diester phosphodiesterase